jgi:threonine/homoserine/homoserine lactone efflux protein
MGEIYDSQRISIWNAAANSRWTNLYFSSKIAEGDKKKSEIYAFGLGAVLSTLVFLTFIALLGSIIQSFISPEVSDLLNIVVGGLLLFFAVRTMIKRNRD